MKNKAWMLGLLLTVGSAWAVNPVTFQIHMDVQQGLGNFNPDTDQVVVRGAFNEWSGANPVLSNTGDMLFSGSFDVDDSFIDQPVEYKFVIIRPTGDVWESVDNRVFTLSTGGQTLDPVYFNNQDSMGQLVNVEVFFSVNLEVMTANGTFDPATDLVVVRGGHANIGNWGGAVALTEEGGNPGHFFLNVQFDGLETDTNLEYKFVILEDGNESSARWESGSNRLAPVSAGLPDTDGDGYGEIEQEEAWFDHVTWDDIIANEVTVHFTADMWPVRAWFTDHPGESNQGLTSYEEITFVGICGPWNNWPWDLVPPQYQLVPTTGDLFEASVVFGQYSARNITYKYGANGHDNESGFQQDWVAAIDDSNPDCYISNQFGALGTLWSDLSVEPGSRPASFHFNAAHPNPFNPGTTLAFTTTQAGVVRLSVVNLAGQEVAELTHSMHSAGEHQISFDASGLASGMYLAVLEGMGESAVQKLMLVK